VRKVLKSVYFHQNQDVSEIRVECVVVAPVLPNQSPARFSLSARKNAGKIRENGNWGQGLSYPSVTGPKPEMIAISTRRATPEELVMAASVRDVSASQARASSALYPDQAGIIQTWQCRRDGCCDLS